MSKPIIINFATEHRRSMYAWGIAPSQWHRTVKTVADIMMRSEQGRATINGWVVEQAAIDLRRCLQ